MGTCLFPFAHIRHCKIVTLSVEVIASWCQWTVTRRDELNVNIKMSSCNMECMLCNVVLSQNIDKKSHVESLCSLFNNMFFPSSFVRHLNNHMPVRQAMLPFLSSTQKQLVISYIPYTTVVYLKVKHFNLNGYIWPWYSILTFWKGVIEKKNPDLYRPLD